MVSAFSHRINNVQVIETVLPVLTCLSQWTQVLSMNGQVTISLTPLAVAKINEKTETLHSSAVQFTRGADHTLVVAKKSLQAA